MRVCLTLVESGRPAHDERVRKRPFPPGNVVMYRMWGIIVVTFVAALPFTGGAGNLVAFAGIVAFSAGAVYATLLSWVYEGEWVKSEEGDDMWVPTRRE